MARISNTGSWHPNYPHTLEQQRAQDWADEHDECAFCSETFHVDELQDLDGDQACRACRDLAEEAADEPAFDVPEEDLHPTRAPR